MTTPQLPPELDKMVRRFQRASDPKRRYEQLLWLAKKLPEMPEAEKIPENKVQGCVSQVYVTAYLDDVGNVHFNGDSDAQLTKGLLAFLIRGTEGLSPIEIVKLAPDFIQDTGLQASLTPSRANGFYNIFKTMKQKALLLAPAEDNFDALDSKSAGAG
ncbi:SufE family protein [Sodalinema gerasimenkoae]|uniref:SufE family protein n=1 Tax=Sodalinema gerasimenkoae TaxID=2862348 RepID=UPI001358298D|nr:SufE family protein [Sodalinema gerasimenkoae]